MPAHEFYSAVRLNENAMGSMAVEERLTPEEYLARERVAETKSEYLDGDMSAMGGASRVHNLVAVNLARELSTKLRDRPCEVYVGGMRVKATDARTVSYLYPDVVVVCGQPELEDSCQDTLLDPNLIVEVLSPSTEAYNRGEKFARYRKIPSLQDYLLISPDRFQVELFSRQGDAWVYSEAHAAGDSVHLPSVDCDLAMDEVYRKVDVASG